jgi:hypothetical protein
MTKTELIQQALSLRKDVSRGNLGDPPFKETIIELIDLIIELLRLKDRR